MLSWNDYYVQEEMRKDKMAQAEHERLVKSFSSQKESSRKKVSSQLRELVGSWMVKRGDSLLDHSEDLKLASQGQ
ncbi:MAG: hypothetical protein MUO54_13185 [Anaerolineales bacterium]|nr:hypothetical protein [Anaerolineales bacterium]